MDAIGSHGSWRGADGWLWIVRRRHGKFGANAKDSVSFRIGNGKRLELLASPSFVLCLLQHTPNVKPNARKYPNGTTKNKNSAGSILGEVFPLFFTARVLAGVKISEQGPHSTS